MHGDIAIKYILKGCSSIRSKTSVYYYVLPYKKMLLKKKKD